MADDAPNVKIKKNNQELLLNISANKS